MPGEAVVVAAAEPFAKVVIVVGLRQVVAVEAVVGILISVRLLIVRRPAVAAIGASGLPSLFVAVVHRLPHYFCPVPVGLAVVRPDAIAERHRRRKVWIASSVALAVHVLLLLVQIGHVLLVDGVLCGAFLLLQCRRRLLGRADLIGERRLVLRVALSLFVYALLLLLRRDGPLVVIAAAAAPLIALGVGEIGHEKQRGAGRQNCRSFHKRVASRQRASAKRQRRSVMCV